MTLPGKALQSSSKGMTCVWTPEYCFRQHSCPLVKQRHKEHYSWPASNATRPHHAERKLPSLLDHLLLPLLVFLVVELLMLCYAATTLFMASCQKSIQV